MNRNERNLAFDEVRNIITTKTASDWDYIVSETQRLFGKDISHTVPIFLRPNDFARTSSIFDPSLILFAWFRFDKTPVLLINSVKELEEAVGKSLCFEFFNTCHFIE